MEQMTIQEALKQGYIHAGKQDTEWQCLHKLEDLTDVDLDESDLFLFSKEFETPSANEEHLKEMISESIADDWANETGDDTEEVYDMVKQVDFKSLADAINEKLKDYKSYKATDIQLIKSE